MLLHLVVVRGAIIQNQSDRLIAAPYQHKTQHDKIFGHRDRIAPLMEFQKRFPGLRIDG